MPSSNGVADSLWNSGRTGVPLILLFAALFTFWQFYIPSPGKAVGALAVAAAIMTFRREPTGLEKFGWMTILFGFLFIEVRAIDKDRENNQRDQIEALKRQEQHFSEARTRQDKHFSGVLQQAQQDFKATMGRMEDLSRLSKEGSDQITGGTSFAYLDFTAADGGKYMPVVVQVGKNPLYGITARLVDLSKPVLRPSIAETLMADGVLRVGDLPSKQAWSGVGMEMSFANKDEIRFNVFFAAKNGTWVQTFRWKQVSGQWTKAYRVTSWDGAKTMTRLICMDKKYPRDSETKTWMGTPSKMCSAN